MITITCKSVDVTQNVYDDKSLVMAAMNVFCFHPEIRGRLCVYLLCHQEWTALQSPTSTTVCRKSGWDNSWKCIHSVGWAHFLFKYLSFCPFVNLPRNIYHCLSKYHTVCTLIVGKIQLWIIRPNNNNKNKTPDRLWQLLCKGYIILNWYFSPSIAYALGSII